MKNLRHIIYISAGVLAMLVLSSCTDEFWGNITLRSANTSAITFSASTSYTNHIETKTLYTDTYYMTDGTWTIRGANGGVERINWLSTDKIRVFSPQAMVFDKESVPWKLDKKEKTVNPTTVPESDVYYSSTDYKVSPDRVIEQKHRASAIPNIDENPKMDWTDCLQWSNSDNVHDFYAVYPSPKISSNPKDHPQISIEAIDEATKVATFYVRGSDHTSGNLGIPVNQGITASETAVSHWGRWIHTPASGTERPNAKYEYVPNMNFVTMAAFKSVATATTVTGRDTVNLDFYPAVTALRVELLADPRDEIANGDGPKDPVTNLYKWKYLERVVLKSDKGSTLTGDYSFQIGGSGHKPNNFSIIDHAGDEIVINLADPSHRVKLHEKDTTVFTFICAPLKQEELTLILYFEDGHTRTMELKYHPDPAHPDPDKTKWITLDAAKKAYLSKVPVFKEYEFRVNLDHVEDSGGGTYVRNNIFPAYDAVFSRDVGFQPSGIVNGLEIVSYRRQYDTSTPPQVEQKPVSWYIDGFTLDGTYYSLTDPAQAATSRTLLEKFIGNIYPASPKPGKIYGFPIKGYDPSKANGDDDIYPSDNTYTHNASNQITTYYPAGMTANQNHNKVDWTQVGGSTREQARDLSYYDLKGNKNAGNKRITANCYTIQGKGWYKIPLVYGNAIDWKKAPTDGNNVKAYKSETSGPTVLNYFKNHENKNITAPWITSGDPNQSLGGMGIDVDGAEIVWMDHDNLITNVEIGDGVTTSKHYLYFRPSDINIYEGNAVIAAKKDGKIVWSWHIWIIHPVRTSFVIPNSGKDGSSDYFYETQKIGLIPNDGITTKNTDPGNSRTGTPGMNSWDKNHNFWRYNWKVYNRGSIENDMLNVNLGYVPGISSSASTPRAILIRFKQSGSGLHQDVRFVQRGSVYGSSVVYYQWGR